MRRRALHRMAVSFFVATLLAIGCASPRDERYNLVLITVDSLRPDHLGFGGYERDTSPVLDRLAAKGVIFERAYSQSGWTLPSIATLLTGQYPRDHGVTDIDRRMSDDLPTLAGILAGQGYDTAAFVSHVFLRAKFGLARGFGVYDDSVLDVGNPHDVATAAAVTDLAIGHLESVSKPFFLWVHYFDPHFRYLPHPADDFGPRHVDRYDGEIAQTDRQIGRLLAALRQQGVSRRTVVVFTADHGEEFGEHGGNYHFGLHEVDVRIPLFIVAPNLEPRTLKRVAQQIDVMPTALDLLGIEPPEGLPGAKLFAGDWFDRPVFIERLRPTPFVQRAMVWRGYKLYAVESRREPSKSRTDKTQVHLGVSVFDLAQDPNELHDIFETDDPATMELLEVLTSFAEAPRASGETVEVEDELEEKLRSLGYVQ